MKTKTIYAVWSEWSDGYDSYYETYDLAHEGARKHYDELKLEHTLIDEDEHFEWFIEESGLMEINSFPLFVKEDEE